ncbi:protein fluG, partial [Aspergillus lentulus]
WQPSCFQGSSTAEGSELSIRPSGEGSGRAGKDD